MNWHLEELERWTKRMSDLEVIIIERCQGDTMVDLIRTIPGCAHYSASIVRNMLVHKQSYFACRDAMIERRKKQIVNRKQAA